MKFFSELIDFKLTALYTFMIALFSTNGIDLFFKIIGGIIFIGYNVHRWYIMHDNHKNSKKQ